MIEIRGVKPTADEVRPLRRGWGLIHWFACLPGLVLSAGVLMMALIAVTLPDYDDDMIGVVGVVLMAIGLFTLVSRAVAKGAMTAAAGKAPSAGLPCTWAFDTEGVRFMTSLGESRHDWAAIKAVREERDRFVLLMTPGVNPVLPKRCLNPEQITALQALIGQVMATGRLGRGAPPA